MGWRMGIWRGAEVRKGASEIKTLSRKGMGMTPEAGVSAGVTCMKTTSTHANVFATETRLRLSINWGRKRGKKYNLGDPFI